MDGRACNPHSRSITSPHLPSPPLDLQGEIENLTSHYVAALGAYRALYLLNWVYRYFTEDDYVQKIVWLAGAPTQMLSYNTI